MTINSDEYSHIFDLDFPLIADEYASPRIDSIVKTIDELIGCRIEMNVDANLDDWKTYQKRRTEHYVPILLKLRHQLQEVLY